jgi:hypothetical protein
MFLFNDIAELTFRLILCLLLAVVSWRLYKGWTPQMGNWRWKDTERLFMFLLALVILAWDISISFIILLRPPNLVGMDPATQAQVLTLIGGAVRSADLAAGMVLGYWYGTSKGSSDKTELLTRPNPTTGG